MDYQPLECYAPGKRIKSKEFSIRSLCWRHLSVWSSCKVSRGFFRRARYNNVQLLCNVSGFVGSGSLVAVMGSSGSGKTTLLAAISHRLRNGIKGDVFVNGEIISRREMTTMTGFVPQDDLAVDSLTIFEHFYFMAVMKMDKRTSEIDRLEKISSLMNQFGLGANSSTYLKNLSGGERKRLSIAVELLTDPQILFCDEPTTGLDSSNAGTVVNVLKNLTSKGKIVMCSIHQPASGLYELFDDVLLLASGGRVAYFGSVIDAVKYFERLSLRCPPSYNVAEFLINVVSVRESSDEDQIKSLCDTYASSKLASSFDEKIEITCIPSTSFGYQNSFCLVYDSMQRVGIVTQLYYLVWRILKSFKAYSIDRIIGHGSFLGTIIMTSLLFTKILYDKKTRMQNIHGFVSILVQECVYVFACSVMNVLPQERPLLLREMGARLYSVPAYYLSKIIYELVLSIVVLCILVTIIKNLSDTFSFLSYTELLAFFFILVMPCVALGYAIGALSDEAVLSVLIMEAFFETIHIFSGIYSGVPSMPACVSWVKYLSLFYFGLESLKILELRSIEIEEMKLNSVRNTTAAFDFKTDSEFGLHATGLSFNLSMLIAYTILYHIVAYVTLSWRSKKLAAY